MKQVGNALMLENLSEIVNPKHTVVVVWHAQNTMIDTTFNKEELVSNMRLLIKAARKNEIPIIYAKTTPYPIGFQSAVKIFMHMKETGVTEPEKIPPVFADQASYQNQICKELSPKENDVVLTTYTGSIFYGTFFENLMRNRNVQTILFTGVATEMGVDSSARDSRNRGFYSIVVEDCVSSSEKKFHEAALITLNRAAMVVSAKEIINEWDQ